MKKETRTFVVGAVVSILILFVSSLPVTAGDYEALKGVKSIKVVVDFRHGNPKSALLQLNLVHQMFKDKNLLAVDPKPAFAVVIIGPAVKLVSTSKDGFPADQHQTIDEIYRTVSKMNKDGIKLEICLVAANVFGVKPETILPEIKKVENGWISVIGYQAGGYALVPVY